MQVKDLFENPEQLPLEVQKILEDFDEPGTYERCAQLIDMLQPYGYTFDYYLDAVPYNLRLISDGIPPETYKTDEEKHFLDNNQTPLYH